MLPRAGWVWWVGTALAAAAGVGLPASRAAADCGAHRISFDAPPFERFAAPRAEKPAKTPAAPAWPAPCHGPNCGRLPPQTTPPAPVNPRPTVGDEWVWAGAATAGPDGPGAAWGHDDSLLRPLFSPTPPVPPPR